ncbi:hypothetical protein [Streptomyces triticirhizae]|uniref:Uncharacterized protein n=1 Tax=Streptomyces triticirhizae TaxID=2483353 RepID=A0A3M2M2U5_9ACTN|nr:hypothetical protein [Streptomyces triticirhizae]RMI43430.1 hypothetical protein EBN88_07335 [Streptomyces triticirhizae]
MRQLSDIEVEALLLGAALPRRTERPSRVAPEDVARSRRRIEAAIGDALWQEALERDEYAQQALDSSSTRRSLGPRPPAVLQDQAGRDLAEFSRIIIRTSHAATDIAGLVHQIDPDGAMVFACLLHLSGRHEGARFWWQFSAGAGKSTAALCLYLLHLQQGDMRDARHWAEQALDLDAQERRPAHHANSPRRLAPRRTFYVWDEPTLYQRGVITIESMLLRTVASLHRGEAAEGRRMSPRLVAAIDGLDSEHHPLFGEIPRPDISLARQMESVP